MVLLDGKLLSSQIKEELKAKIDDQKKRGTNIPGLVVILVGDNPASEVYVSSKGKACLEIGMRTKTEKRPSSIMEKELLDLIEKYNNDDDYHGILVQLPLPKHIDESKVISSISPKKDVDGFHPENVGNLVIGNETFVSCTPAGIFEMLKRYNIDTKGKHVVIVGRSNIVGKPMANIMMQKKDGANSIVTICHSAADDISVYTKQADILIAAIGVPNLIKGEMIKDGAAVIDVGINRLEDASSKRGYKIVGDVDFKSASEKASHITPVPGGVGPMTIAMLLQNTYKAFELYGKQN